MNYRKFGKCDFSVSLLGFGAMRMPVIDGDSGNIDEEKAIAMIRRSIDLGVNYVDTAYPYHKGNSEPLVAKALQNGYRQKVKLATKLPVWLVKTAEDFDRLLDEQLAKLETDSIDLYLLHALNEKSWQSMKELGVLEWLPKIVADGRVKCIGFSFHDELPLFKEIVDAYPWDFCQIQLNYMDEEYQAGLEGMRYAAAKDIAIVIMEPLRGGKLVKNLPDEVLSLWAEAETQRSPAEWALRWVANFPEVACILSGMSTMEQVEENARICSEAPSNSLTKAELALINKVRDFYRQRTKVGCTDCAYCLPCPTAVHIPGIFNTYNEASIYNTVAEAMGSYSRLTDAEKDFTRCVDCGQCETACPQNLPIRQLLKEAHAFLTKQ